MVARSITLVSSVCLALLPILQGRAEAGYVSADLTSLQSTQQEEIGVSRDDGAGAAEAEWVGNQPQHGPGPNPEPLLARPSGAFEFGGMSAPAGEKLDRGFSLSVAIPPIAATDAPMVAWLHARESGWSRAPFSTGIFRPPRVTH